MEISKQIRFHVGQNLDVLDNVKKWINAEILFLDSQKIYVHYTGWSAKYDQFINLNSPRILQQWEPGRNIRINNRLDVYHSIGGWLEARVIQIDHNNNDKIKVHFFNYHQKYDLWVDINDRNQVSIIGFKSKAFGIGKKRTKAIKKQLSQEAIKILRQKLEKFQKTLERNRWIMRGIQGDGNCLFRSISHQLYGSENHHKSIRQLCMTYISYQKNFFQNYIAQDIQQYVQRKKKDGQWGDDVQIQAISEIYSRPIQIYAFGQKPIKTFHQQSFHDIQPIRLAYVGSCHYNSINQAEKMNIGLLHNNFGQFQQNFLASLDVHHQNMQVYRNQFSNMNTVQDTIGEAVEAQFRSDYKSEDSFQKVLQMSQTQAILEQIEQSQINQLKIKAQQQKLQQQLKQLEQKQLEQAQKMSKLATRPYWFNDLKTQGFSEKQIEFAIQIKGYDPDAVLNFLLDNMF